MAESASLELVTTEELIDELGRRSSAAVVLVERPHKLEGRLMHITIWRGPMTTCLGLLELARMRMLNMVAGAENEVEDDD